MVDELVVTNKHIDINAENIRRANKLMQECIDSSHDNGLRTMDRCKYLVKMVKDLYKIRALRNL